MKRRLLLTGIASALAAIDLLPVWLIAKQSITPESESFAWPPTWVPHRLTFDHFAGLSGTVELSTGLGLSFSIALLTVMMTLLLTFPAAWLAARSPRTDRQLDVVVFFTRTFPSLALAVPLAALFVRLGLYNHRAGVGLWLAHTVVAIPFAFFVLRNGIRDLPPQLEEAAALDGATPWVTFWYIELPLLRPALAAAAMLVFVISWDEFAYALLLQVTHRTLPALVYYFSAFGYPGMASATAVVMLLPAVAIILLLEPSLRSGGLAGSGR